MKMKIPAVCVLLAHLVCAATALATAPLGPPTASLQKGQFAIALEYAYTSTDMDLSSGTEDDTVEGVRSNTMLAQPAYGLTDNWEVYALLGAADLREGHLECNYEFAYGFGTKTTFYQDPNTAWGILFEIGWRKANDDGILDLTGLNMSKASYSAEFEYHEITVAIGPTCTIAEGCRLYGGPFFYVLEGDLDVENASTDKTISIDEGAMVGAYLGTELDLCPNSTWYAEFQFSADMQVLGTGIKWKF